ncbi:S-layer homology domain-containing protein, partial [Candidatus Peregrinibacteria bacterium]|nr:S-layer homology domain-containing protein [Candidatus Peregrinibacteria bacterium]
MTKIKINSLFKVTSLTFLAAAMSMFNFTPAFAAVIPPSITCKITQDNTDYKVDLDYIDVLKNAPTAKTGQAVHWEMTLVYAKTANSYKSYSWTESIDNAGQKLVSNVTSKPTTEKTINNVVYNTTIMQKDTIYPAGTKRVDANFNLTTLSTAFNPPKNVVTSSGCAVLLKDPISITVQPAITPTTIKTPLPTSIPNTTVNLPTIPASFPIDYTKSTFVANPTSVKADGTSLSNLTATIYNSIGNPVANTEVTIMKTSVNSGVPTFSSKTVKTDNSGVAKFTVKADYEGIDTYAVTLGTPAKALDQKATIVFTAINTNNSNTPTPQNNQNTNNNSQNSNLQNNTSTPTNSSSSNNSSSSDAVSTNTPALLDSPDIISCKGRGKSLFFENDEPAFDRFGVDCYLNKRALVNAAVYSKEYDPKSEDNSANLIRKISNQDWKDAKKYYFDWNGYDDFDQSAALDEYVFVVEARINDKYKPDISIQKFTIINTPTETAKEDQTLHGAAEESDQTILDNIADQVKNTDNTESIPTAEASKCPGVNYPNDIAGIDGEELIKKSYDECLIKGYQDGTFRPQGNLTRAEATKIIILTTGNLAKQGCYDADCGSPFDDLDMWQGPWIRSAWDLKMVSGICPRRFAPNRQITRAEAAALVVKAFGFTPKAG